MTEKYRKIDQFLDGKQSEINSISIPLDTFRNHIAAQAGKIGGVALLLNVPVLRKTLDKSI